MTKSKLRKPTIFDGKICIPLRIFLITGLNITKLEACEKNANAVLEVLYFQYHISFSVLRIDAAV